jgi:hypothetical protein
MRAEHAKSAALLRLDRFIVVVAFLLLTTLAVTAPLYVGISGMRIEGCRTGCSTSLLGAGGTVIIAGCVGVTVTAFLGLLVLPRPNRYLWWLPCSALAVAGAILLIGNRLIDLGVGA